MLHTEELYTGSDSSRRVVRVCDLLPILVSCSLVIAEWPVGPSKQRPDLAETTLLIWQNGHADNLILHVLVVIDAAEVRTRHAWSTTEARLGEVQMEVSPWTDQSGHPANDPFERVPRLDPHSQFLRNMVLL